MLIKSILQAIDKNGLECGLHSNFDDAQLRYIIEDRLSSFSQTKFKVLKDGTIGVLPPGKHTSVSPDEKNVVLPPDESVAPDEKLDGLVPGQTISEPKKPQDEQKFIDSGIIIKDCFRNVTQQELEQVRNWIADFEKGNV